MASWQKPISNYYKLNIKGIFSRAEMKSSVGCVIRDSNGEWVRGSGGVIGLAIPITSQLWALFYGIKLAWEHEHKRLMVEYESPEVLEEIKNPDPNHDMADLVTMITNLLKEEWDDIQLYHTPASANHAATELANHCLLEAGGIDEFVEPPTTVKDIVDQEGGI